MKVLSISTDRKIFDEKSSVLKRMVYYASKVEEMHIIVFTKRGYKERAVGNLFIHPTNSVSKFSYIFDARRLGEMVIKKYNLSLSNSVISTQDPFETGLAGYFLHKRFFLPMQVQIHTDFLSSHFKNGALNIVRVLIAYFVIPKAQGIRVVSEAIKESLSKSFPKLKVSPAVLPVFVDIEGFANAVPQNYIDKDFPNFKFIIFMASRLSKEKKIENALYALKKVVNEFPQTGLVIAGSGPEKQSLVRKIEKLGLSKNVVFIGWQDNLASYYKTADLFLLTSDYEGYGMTLIEAGASGCPIVTTKVGLAKTDLFKDGINCLVCPVGDKKCLSDAVISMIHDNSKREVFKRKMLDDIKVQALSMDEYVTEYVSLLRGLIVNK